LNQTPESVLWSDYHDLIAQFGPKSFSFDNQNYTHNGSDYKPFVDQNGNNVHDLLKQIDFDQKYEILNKIIPWDELKTKSKRDDYWTLLNDFQIKQIAQSELIEIGSHSFFHNNLSNIQQADAFSKILNSKVCLEHLIDKSIQSIAYPNSSYTRELIDYSTQLGFEKQLAVKYNYSEDKEDPRILSRVDVYEYETFAMQKINIMQKWFILKKYLRRTWSTMSSYLDKYLETTRIMIE
jgi:peptidoglycan/xylan/chitin deacetylase (PgdA/CDA1 family)